MKAFKHVRKQIRINSHAVVFNDDVRLRVRVFEDKLNYTALRSKLDCIRQQIPYNLLQPPLIGNKPRSICFYMRLEPKSLSVNGWTNNIDSQLNYPSKISWSSDELKLSFTKLRRVEKVFDKLQLLVRIPLYHFNSFRVNRPIVWVGLQEFGPAHHSGQRRSQFVRNSCEEFIFSAIGC